MSSFDQRQVSRSIPGWLISLGVAWALPSIVGLFFVGRKIATLRGAEHNRGVVEAVMPRGGAPRAAGWKFIKKSPNF